MPREAAARSASDSAAATHVASVPPSAPPTTVMRPPPPRLVCSVPPSSRANETGPRFDASTTGRSPGRGGCDTGDNVPIPFGPPLRGEVGGCPRQAAWHGLRPSGGG